MHIHQKPQYKNSLKLNINNYNFLGSIFFLEKAQTCWFMIQSSKFIIEYRHIFLSFLLHKKTYIDTHSSTTLTHPHARTHTPLACTHASTHTRSHAPTHPHTLVHSHTTKNKHKLFSKTHIFGHHFSFVHLQKFLLDHLVKFNGPAFTSFV